MTSPMVLRSNDGIIKKIKFKPYRNATERQAVQFLPGPNEPQETVIKTPWGGELTVQKGDYIVNELNHPENRWPVQKDIFEDCYIEVRPGFYIKDAITHLAHLKEITGDPHRLVTVHTLEGAVTVRAGDFYLARGSHEEIWPIPREKVETTLELVEE